MFIPAQIVVEPASYSGVRSATPANPKAQSRLPDLRAAALDQNSEYDRKEHTGDDPNDCWAFHIDSSFDQLLKNVLNDSIIKITAGPRVTRKSAGKMKNTSGNTSLTDVFAANSSIICIRLVRRLSEC